MIPYRPESRFPESLRKIKMVNPSGNPAEPCQVRSLAMAHFSGVTGPRRQIGPIVPMMICVHGYLGTPISILILPIHVSPSPRRIHPAIPRRHAMHLIFGCEEPTDWLATMFATCLLNAVPQRQCMHWRLISNRAFEQ